MSLYSDDPEPAAQTIGEWQGPDGLRFEAQSNPPLATLRAVNDGLGEHNRVHIGDFTWERLGVFAWDGPERQTLIGGVFGDLIWDWLHIESLWTDAEQRGRGIGSALMRHIEEVARGRGVVNIHLETASFQALPFYLALGYEVFGELPDHPIGSTWYYLRKFGAPLAPQP